MKILILFSTMMGTTEAVVKIIQKNLIESGNLVDMRNVYDSLQINLSEYDVLIFGTPTYNEVLEINMEQYISQTAPDLSRHKIAIFGLGDKAYPQYCTSVDILEKWVIKNSGKLTVPSLRIDGYPRHAGFIDVWAEQINSSFVRKANSRRGEQ